MPIAYGPSISKKYGVSDRTERRVRKDGEKIATKVFNVCDGMEDKNECLIHSKHALSAIAESEELGKSARMRLDAAASFVDTEIERPRETFIPPKTPPRPPASALPPSVEED